jgi:hypothetical protein
MDRAPKRVRMPATNQTNIVKDVEYIYRAMVVGTRKIPEPIMVPTLIIVASRRVRVRFIKDLSYWHKKLESTKICYDKHRVLCIYIRDTDLIDLIG